MIMKTINYSEIKEALHGFDLFICSSSFEERCLGVSKHLNIEKFQNFVICHFSYNYPEADKNLAELKNIFDNQSIVVELGQNTPLANYDKLYDTLDKDTYTNVLLDISTFTREIFLMILQLFRQESFITKNLTLCYNPSDKYSSVSNNELDKLWLSKGVQNIRAVLGYSGDFSPIKKSMLIVLVGFEAERAEILIDSYEPSILFIGKAKKEESKNDELAKINDINFKKLQKLNPNAEKFDFSCIDLSPTINSINQIVEKYRQEYNIVISPMSNKLSTLAVASVVFKYPEVQICYAATNLYNVNAYSTPSEHIHVIDANDL